MSDKNKSLLIPLSGWVPVRDLEVVDEEQLIWRGTIVDHPHQEMDGRLVYFSREYLPEVNELDQIYKEKFFSDESIRGFPFWMIPKEKLFFTQMPASSIVRPDPRTFSKRNLRMQ